MLINLMKQIAYILGYAFELQPLPRKVEKVKNIPDVNFYRPIFSPWLGYGEFSRYYELAKPYTLVSSDRCWILYCLARQAAILDGDWVECGVFRGGTATMLARLFAENCSKEVTFHLFDTFAGMPETDSNRDLHKKGVYSNTSIEDVRKIVGDYDFVKYHKGFIPDTFSGCGINRISFAHIDVDIYKSVMDCCNYVYPKLVTCAFMVFDDYGFPSCPGGRQAVDDYFMDLKMIPIILPTGQAIIFKSRC
jgi:O-methyltransferase